MNKLNLKISGHLKIYNHITGEIYIEQNNAINYENMSIAMANLIKNNSDSEYSITRMDIGNGGYDSDNIKKSENIAHEASLYNKINLTSDNIDSSQIIHNTGSNYSDIIFLKDLENDDFPSDITSYNEIALRTDGSSDKDFLLSHVIFPNKDIPTGSNTERIAYTIRISTG